jgi:hypothetical protein
MTISTMHQTAIRDIEKERVKPLRVAISYEDPTP